MPLAVSLPTFLQFRPRRLAEQASLLGMYGLPTRFGIYMALVLLSLVALGLRIENNMLIAVAALLSALFFFSVLWGAANLAGARVEIAAQAPVFAQQPNMVGLVLKGDRPMPGIALFYQGRQAAPAVPASSVSEQRLHLAWQPEARGWQSVSPVRLQSSFPLNMVRMWTPLRTSPTLVAPAPASVQELAGIPGMEALVGRLGSSEDDTPTELSAALPGDPPARILWKQHARRGVMLKRGLANDQQADRLELDYARLSHLGHERALSVLCGGLRASHEAGLAWRLVIGAQVVDSTTPQAYKRATDALALA